MGDEQNKKSIGAKYEQIACDYLQEKGVAILERNFRCRQGEIDIVGRHEGYLVFVEVKYRATQNKGSAAEAVTINKQKKICRVADFYRYCHRQGDDCPVRYDVVAIQKEEEEDVITWYKDAFWHVY